MQSDTLLVERDGHVLRLTLNRPEHHNALTADLCRRLVDRIRMAEEDRDISVIVLKGANRTFCAGYDLSSYDTEAAEVTLHQDALICRRSAEVGEAIWRCDLPVLTQVEGFALAGGTDMVLASDMAFFARSARIGHPAVRNLGTPPFNMWLYRVGAQQAKRMLLTGDVIQADEAIAMGMGLRCYEDDQIEDEVMAVAQRIALVDRDCLVSNKHVINSGIDLMGRAELQKIAAREDAIAHRSVGAEHFRQRAEEIGLSKAFKERDARFGPSGALS